MKRVYLFIFVFLLAVSLVFAAETNSSVCGNGILEGDEECETGHLPSCESLGYVYGAIECPNCKLDTSKCINSTPESQYKCTESDNGQDYFVKGAVTYPTPSTKYTDFCYDTFNCDGSVCVYHSDFEVQGAFLKEYYCGEEGYLSIDYECPNGCDEGKCLSESEANKGGQESGQENVSGNDSAGQGSQHEVAVKTMNQGEESQLKIQTSSEFGSTIRSGNGSAEAKTSMKMSQGEDGKTYAQLSNGMKAEVKVMPDAASQKALEVLGARCEEEGCSIELKEVGKKEEAKAAYEVKAKKQVKFLGFIKSQMRTKAQVDAETGEVVRTRNAWWGFLASKK